MTNQESDLYEVKGSEDVYCPSCEEFFSESAFDEVDDEFDPSNPMCPDCQSERRIAGSECEDCDQPATHEVERGVNGQLN